MRQTHISAERLLDAPADGVYRCIADYRQHHRPGGFLPPAFTDSQIERGGVGAGTVISYTLALGGRRRAVTSTVSEPRPGRELVETARGVRTTFTVEPEGERARVRFDTVLEASGIDGLLTRLLAPRLLRPVYADELARLERYAQAQVDLRPRSCQAHSLASA
jgi:hypothetical protein